MNNNVVSPPTHPNQDDSSSSHDISNSNQSNTTGTTYGFLFLLEKCLNLCFRHDLTEILTYSDLNLMIFVEL